MTCKKCPYLLVCWSGTYIRTRCQLCKRLILDSSFSDEFVETEELIIVLNCCEDVEIKYKSDDWDSYDQCPRCDTRMLQSWREYHRWIRERAGWRFVLKRRSSGVSNDV